MLLCLGTGMMAAAGWNSRFGQRHVKNVCKDVCELVGAFPELHQVLLRCREGKQLHYPARCFKAGKEMIQIFCQGGVNGFGWIRATPVVGELV